MRGFSVFSAFIGTIIFIISIVLVTLFVQTDSILKQNTITSEYESQLQGSAGIVNAIFQASIIESGEKAVESMLYNITSDEPDPNLIMTVICHDPTSCKDELFKKLKREFKNHINKDNIVINIINVVLGSVNAVTDFSSFTNSFDLELDPENNQIVVLIHNKKPVLKVNLGGQTEEYTFSIVANDFDSKYDFSDIKNVAETLGKIFEKLPEVDAKCMSVPSCAECCKQHCSTKDGHSYCCVFGTTTINCFVYDNVTVKPSFIGNDVSISYDGLKKTIEKKGYRINEDTEKIKNIISQVISDIDNLKYEINNANTNSYIAKELNLIKKYLNGKKEINGSKKIEIISQLSHLEHYLGYLLKSKLICINSQNIRSIIKDQHLKKYINKKQILNRIYNYDKVCFMKIPKQSKIGNGSYHYLNITPSIGSCPDVTRYYNDDLFKEDLKTYLKNNLRDYLVLNKLDVKLFDVKSNISIGDYRSYAPITGCGDVCGCIGIGSREYIYKITDIDITLPIKVCQLNDMKKCKTLWVRFSYG